MISLIEIVRSWLIAAEPSDAQFNQALQRAAHCQSCDALRVTRPSTNSDVHQGDHPTTAEQPSVETLIDSTSFVCGACGCPIRKKVFSPRGRDACPQSRWME